MGRRRHKVREAEKKRIKINRQKKLAKKMRKLAKNKATTLPNS